MKCKLEVVSGFLGSGKTSFINSYLTTDICKNEKILVVLLERGVKDIEKYLNYVNVIYIKDLKNLKELILDEIKKKRYTRAIIEFNGTYDLSIMSNLLRDKDINKLISFYGNYYIGSADNLEIYLKNIGEIIIPFIQSSKLIVLNNLEVIDKKSRDSLVRIIESINFTAPIIYSENINELEKDLRTSGYFKKSLLTRGFLALCKKEEK